jgi:catechol 2,3-dioxygenase-like lactoylglutathione lyase family enzyme
LTENATGPAVTGFHHFAPTVSDVEGSAQWYQRVFGMNRVPVPFPHHAPETTGLDGYAVLLLEPRSGVAIGLHHHEANAGERFEENRTGLDHMSFSVADRVALDSWTAWLDQLAVPHSGVIEVAEPVPYSVVVFRDPDNIQLELFHMPS